MRKVSKEEYKNLKRKLMILNPYGVSKRSDRSFKTVLQVKASKSYEDYQLMSQSQHPPTKYSLAEDVLKLHALLYKIGEVEDYVVPSTARRAIEDIFKIADKELQEDEGLSIEQYLCHSYADDDGNIKDCKCGRCE